MSAYHLIFILILSVFVFISFLQGINLSEGFCLNHSMDGNNQTCSFPVLKQFCFFLSLL